MALPAGRVRDRQAEAVVEEAPVGQASQAVMEGEGAVLLLRLQHRRELCLKACLAGGRIVQALEDLGCEPP